MTPEGWRTLKLGDVVTVVGGFGFPRQYQGHSDLPYPFFKVSDMNEPGNARLLRQANNYVDDELLKKMKAKLYPEGTIVFPKVGAALLTNKRRLLGSEGLFDNNLMGLIPRDVSRDYLFCVMQTIDFAEIVQAGAVPSVNGTMVKALILALPPLPEQRKIAAILSSVDEVIEKTEAVIDRLQVVKKAMMQELLTRGLPGRHTRFKQTEIGEIPEEWEVRSIPDCLVKLKVGTRYDKGSRLDEGQTPIVDQSAEGYFGFHNNAPGVDATRDAPVVTFANHTCAVRWHVLPFSVIQNVFPLRGAEGVATRFLYFILEDLIPQTGYKGHWPAVVEKLVAVPPEGEQKEMVAVFESISGRINFEQDALVAQRTVKSALMSVLLTGEVRVTPEEEAA